MPHARRLVIVDDDPHVLSALRFAFEVEGYEVCTFSRGEDLLANPSVHARTCLVVDERLPGISGLETIAALRAQGIGAPAILITTNPAKITFRRATLAGVGIVEKPLIGDSLAAKVRTMLGA